MGGLICEAQLRLCSLANSDAEPESPLLYSALRMSNLSMRLYWKLVIGLRLQRATDVGPQRASSRKVRLLRMKIQDRFLS